MDKPVMKQLAPAYDWLEISKYIEDKYSINMREYKGERKDFWTFLANYINIQRGMYFNLSSEMCFEDWHREIIALFIQEFGDNIRCWVDW